MKTNKPIEGMSPELAALANQGQAMLKSHVDTYTRKDGVTVQAHDDKRQAAQPEQPSYRVTHNVSPSGSSEGAIHEIKAKPAAVEAKLGMKPGSLSPEQGGHYSQSHQITHPDGTKHSVYSNGGDVRIRPVGHNNQAATDALKQHLDGGGEKPADAKPAVPGIGVNAKVLRASSKDGDLDHWTNQSAADSMEKGDTQSLKYSLRSMDTAARDHVLDHIHPDHWEGLGFKPTNKDKSVKAHDAKFGGGGEVKAENHPKGHKPGGSVMFPHPEKPGKKALGKYVGQRNGKSVIHHDKLGEQEVANADVSHAAGVPKPADLEATKEAGASLRAGMAKEKASAKPADAAPAQADSNSAKWDDLPDEKNPKHALSRIGSAALGQAAQGKDDLKQRAKVELANNGLDSDAKWVGHAAAHKHHGTTAPGAGDEPDEIASHFQTFHPSVLSAAAKGHLDLNQQAKRALAARGHDSSGSWVGFDKAKAHHFGADAKAPAKAAAAPKDTPMAKALFFVTPETRAEFDQLAKSHVKAHTKKDGSFVKDYDTKVVKRVEAHGVKGMKSTPWRKEFKSEQHFNEWAEKDGGNHQVLGFRELDDPASKTEGAGAIPGPVQASIDTLAPSEWTHSDGQSNISSVSRGGSRGLGAHDVLGDNGFSLDSSTDESDNFSHPDGHAATLGQTGGLTIKYGKKG